MLLRGLIGDVEHRLALEPLFFQEHRERAAGTQKEPGVFRRIGRGVPAEEAAARLPPCTVDGRSGFGPPLGEEVGDLEAFHTAASRHGNEPFQQGKSNRYVSPSFYAHQLDTGPSPSGFCIQGGVKTGVSTMFMPSSAAALRKLFPQLPMLGRIDGHPIIGGQAIPRGTTGYRSNAAQEDLLPPPEGRLGRRSLPHLQVEGDGVLPGGEALGHSPIDPQHGGQE